MTKYDAHGNPQHRRRYKPSIWNKLQRNGMTQVAEETSMPIEFRLWAYVTTRVGIAGHAEFEDGQLERVMTKVTVTTGEVGNYGKRRINQAIEIGVATGLYAPGSNRRCIIVNAGMLDVDRDYLRDEGDEAKRVCDEHGHYDHWLGDCWVTTDTRGGWVLVA